MKPYKDSNGDSGIIEYEYGDNWISLKIKYGGVYTYRSARVGATHIATMKRLADAGDGLNSYINTHPDVKKGCDPR